MGVALNLSLSASALAGDPLTDIKINEVESNGAADFIELVNTSGTATDVSGLVLKDDNDANALVIPAATSIPAGGFLAIDTDVAGGFGLGQPDAARVFMPDGTTLIDSTHWPLHAAGTTYGRCPDGTGIFLTTVAITKGSANLCISPLPQTWPGSASVTPADQTLALGADNSGLDYEGTGTSVPGVLWVVDNGNSLLRRLLWNGSEWVADTANGWTSGKVLHFPGGAGGLPDSEGVTLTDQGSAGGVFVSSERDLSVAASRVSILRYDVSGAAATLDATREWNLTPDLPAVGPNSGAESVEWVSDEALVSAGFFDEAKGKRYDPADYPDHGSGIFFVGLEANGSVYAYALNQTASTFTRVATFASGFSTFGALHWDPDNNQLWVVCDNNCDGRSRVFSVDSAGHFALVADYARPAGMDNFNNEGFTITPDTECVGGSKPVFWADDGNDANHALRAGTLPCTPPAPPIGRTGWSAPTSVHGDFNGDGFTDLAIGAPGENNGQGAVHVLLGSAGGLTAAGSQFWSQNSAGISDTAENGDGLGRALAVGNFNGDAFADLAIGAPGENGGRGAVHVLFGSATGLTATGSRFFTQATSGIADDPEAGDHFGATLAAGNFDTSTAATELAIGVPDENSTTLPDVGIVQVLKGTPSGLTGAGSQTWSQNSAGIADAAEAGDRFGSSLAAGNLGGSTADDLAIGVPEEDVGAVKDAGVVHVLLGSSSGLVAAGSTLWRQGSGGIGDTAEASDGFGAALAIGNIGISSYGDLVVGVPGEDIGAAENAGMIQTVPGSASGPTGAGSQIISQATSGIADAPETGDEFGFAVALGNFGANVFADLAVGVPGEGSSTHPHHGVVQLIPGSKTGLTATGGQLWSQNSANIAGGAEDNDRFGAALAAGDFDNSGFADLAIGVPGEAAEPLPAVGLVHVLPGTAAFLTGTNSLVFSQNTAGIADASEPFDVMGLTLGR